MNKRRICLFTAYSPQTGGGGVILRSLVKELPDSVISWYYISDNAVPGYEEGYLGKALMGSTLIKDTWQTWKMLAGYQISFIDNLVKRLINIECDEYWIVSHNEGLRLAVELNNKQNLPVHMTVHDDWAGAICARSIRYRPLTIWANKLTISALKLVPSFDVISEGMQSYYKEISGRQGEVCHRYLPEKCINEPNSYSSKQAEITVGHIGSIYDKDDFIAFLTLFCDFAQSKSKVPVMKMWGCHLTINDVPEQFRNYIFFYPTLPEESVIKELYKCDFVYAMYPFNKALSVFSRTSLPTKLTSYLQAGKPILGHGPADSTLMAFLNTTRLGVMWSSLNRDAGFKALENILNLEVTYEQLKNARRQYFGEENLAVMHRLLSNNIY